MKDESLALSSSPLPAMFAKNLYERMLLTRLVDEHACQLQDDEYTTTCTSCRGSEAAQIGSAVCIEVGQDFTLPSSRDLGVVLAIGMTPYEVFRTYLDRETVSGTLQQAHWSYHKHNTVTGPTPVATQILHAAGIAFASKLRKAHAVTIAYCSNDVVVEPDFLEGIRFSAHHNLPILFICEHTCQDTLSNMTSCLDEKLLPENLTHHAISGVDVTQVYTTMQHAMHHAREGQGAVLLEIFVSQPPFSQFSDNQDPLLHCKQLLQVQGTWGEEWATQLQSRLRIEVEQALRDAVQDAQESNGKGHISSSRIS